MKPRCSHVCEAINIFSKSTIIFVSVYFCVCVFSVILRHFLICYVGCIVLYLKYNSLKAYFIRLSEFYFYLKQNFVIEMDESAIIEQKIAC